MAKQTGYTAENGCPVEATLDVLGGKWKGMLMYLLLNEAMRYSALKRMLYGISERTLTKQLRELQALGLVERLLEDDAPLAAYYRLTPCGQTLKPVLLAMEAWGLDFMSRTRPPSTRPVSPQEAIVMRRKTGVLPDAAVQHEADA